MKRTLKLSAIAMAFTLLLSSGFISCKKAPKPEDVKVDDLAINVGGIVKLTEGGTTTLTYTVTPPEAESLPANWTSSDEGVAIVDKEGNVTAVGKGTATITLEVGGVKSTCGISVVPKITNLVINASATSVEVGKTINLTYTVTPPEAESLPANWTSSDEGVAIVDKEGNVTAVGKGTATISLTVGNYPASIAITVTDPIVDVMVVAAGATRETPGFTNLGAIWHDSILNSPQTSYMNSFAAVTYDPTNKIFYFGGSTTKNITAGTALCYSTSDFNTFKLSTPTLASTTVKSAITSMFFGKDGKLYAAGEYSGQPVYWTDKAMSNMASSSWSGPNNSIYVDGSDVYTCGTNTNGLSWADQSINGVSQTVDGSSNSCAYGITVYNGKPYMCGQTVVMSALYFACVWCGNNKTTLDTGDDYKGALANSICSRGDGSFVIGGYVQNSSGDKSPVLWIGNPI